MRFRVVLHPSEEGFAVNAPSLPGCWSQGRTREEALENIADAIREYLDAEVEPAEGAEVRDIEVAVQSSSRSSSGRPPRTRRAGLALPSP